jgi:ubiquinone/menaquinone biosynthesis C-methylase UbiE
MASAIFWDKAANKYAASKIADMGGYEETLTRTRSFLHAEDHLHEIGCGTGSTALKLAPFVRQLTATDISGGMLAIANEKLQKTDLTNLSFVQSEVTKTIDGGPFARLVYCICWTIWMRGLLIFTACSNPVVS